MQYQLGRDAEIPEKAGQLYAWKIAPQRDAMRCQLIKWTCLIPYFNWDWAYVVATSSPIPDLAYQFCTFAVTAENSTYVVAQSDGFFDLFRSEHYGDDVIADVNSKSFLDVHKASPQSAIPDFYVAQRAKYIGALSRWISRAL